MKSRFQETKSGKEIRYRETECIERVPSKRNTANPCFQQVFPQTTYDGNLPQAYFPGRRVTDYCICLSAGVLPWQLIPFGMYDIVFTGRHLEFLQRYNRGYKTTICRPVNPAQQYGVNPGSIRCCLQCCSGWGLFCRDVLCCHPVYAGYQRRTCGIFKC